MSEDPVRKYLDGKAKLDKALSEVQKLASVVEPIGSALRRDPWHLIVSNIDVGFPAEVSLVSGIPTLNAQQWPNAKQIAETLAAMHHAQHEVSNLWATVPTKDKGNLTPPKQVY